MTRTAHDQFAKQYLEELLAYLGQVQTSRDVPSEVRQIDVYFVPAATPSTAPETLGVLGQMAATTGLFEVFRNAPTPVEIRTCKLKLYSLQGDLLRQARREKNSLGESDLPRLWVLSPSCSERLVNGFGAQLDESGNWLPGIYFMPEFEKTALVALDQLPANLNTLWLRVLGRGATQQQAVNELLSLPKGHPFRRNLLEILANWRINVQLRQNQEEENRELIMNLSPAYYQWREEAVQEGIQQERKQRVQELLKFRFGSIDEELASIIEALLQVSGEELIPLLLTLSREELLQRFGRS
ncbi:hypothetical protein [Laspinema olomoucense]|uniref:hypothetical protein n=1 Tax=Laspinema olomoucense TaxID=3231600 RepID=UPI0021BAEFB0|nr:hypothetical protein [Laspinema sp. D3c]MCT7993352.1 hypothetical protein [Laspinema sp. D3c]